MCVVRGSAVLVLKVIPVKSCFCEIISPRLSSAGWAVRLGWFRVCVRTGVACVWFRAVCAEVEILVQVCVYGTCLVSVRDA